MNIESAIQWYQSRIGKTRYSMEQRNGQGNPPGYDCSSSLYYSLIQSGALPVGIYIGNTDSLFGDLERHGFTQIAPNAQGNFDTRRGDVFIWGIRGNSGGSLGHTGLFQSADDILASSYYYNGIHVNNYDSLRAANNYPVQTFYRYTGATTPQPAPGEAVDQVINPGSYIKFPSNYIVTDVQHVADLWQIASSDLCKKNFTWADNGIPAAPVIEIDGDGYATADQSLDIGSRFVIPGKYQVLDVGQSDGRWLGQIAWNGFKFWVDLEPVEEVDANNVGTTPPGARPQQAQTTTTTTEVPNVTTTTTVPSTTETTTVSGDTTGPITTTTSTNSETTTDTATTTSTTTEITPPIGTGFWATVWLAVMLIINKLRGKYHD